LAEEAARARPWDGVTLSGGEPFLQGGALSEFLDALRRLVGAFSTIAFTGYRFGELQRRGGSAAALLDRVDLLVDGPYREARSSQLPLRGSANQRLIALTAVGASLRERVERDPPPGCEVQIGEGGEVILSGFPPVDLIRRVRELLAESTSPTSAEGRR
jgi:anaerobic ribonucleoside-triphosphate reductase activating protein